MKCLIIVYPRNRKIDFLGIQELTVFGCFYFLGIQEFGHNVEVLVVLLVSEKSIYLEVLNYEVSRKWAVFGHF